ncbi:MAG: hypothetical protein WBX15_05985 [Thermoanaerobaculia bacterium]
MEVYDFRAMAKWSDARFQSVVVFREPSQRGMLLCMKAGQEVPEHSADGVVSVQAITGHVVFWDEETPADLVPGQAVRVDRGRRHRVEAKEESIVFVTITAVPDQT